MPIKGLTERRQLPRIGKIHLGVKKVKLDEKGKPKLNKYNQEITYPVETNFFVCPPEVEKIYGKEPKSLDIIIPVEDEEIWASQYYRQYSRTRGLVCKGDGCTCRRMLDTQTGNVPTRETKEAVWNEGLICAGRDCPDYKSKACQEVMNLQFLLPKVPGLGVWQIDTGSIHSIININNCATMIRATTPNGRVSWIPLTLTRELTETNNPETGKKENHYCLHLRYAGNLENLLTDSNKPRLELVVGKPVDDEEPDDTQLSYATPEKAEAASTKAQADAEELWGDTPAEKVSHVIEGQVLQKPPTPSVTQPAANPGGKMPEDEVLANGLNMDWLRGECNKLGWTSQKDIADHLRLTFNSKPNKSVQVMLEALTQEEVEKLVKNIQAKVEELK